MAPDGALRRVVLRHSLVTRLSHWITALVMSLSLVSGLQIFKAFPALYLGDTGYANSGAVFETGVSALNGGTPAAWLRIGSHRWMTTGLLGRWLTTPPNSRDLAASQRSRACRGGRGGERKYARAGELSEGGWESS
jgi:hypothetical protein